MRTTLHLDDDAYRIAVRHARLRRIGLGKAVSELVVKAARFAMPTRRVDGIIVFDPQGEFPKVTPRQVRRILAQEED